MSRVRIFCGLPREQKGSAIRSCVFAAFLCLSYLPSSTSAGIKPSFVTTISAWKASDIVIVTEGAEIDGHFEVLEVLKGTLSRGDEITLEALARFADPERRRVKKPWYGRTDEGRPFYVTGQEMVLFLKADPDGQSEEEGAWLEPWAPAAIFSDWTASVVWVEGADTYGFLQPVNPGPSELYRLGQSATELIEMATEVSRLRDEFMKALGVADLNERAWRLKHFAGMKFHIARLDAFRQLADCGPDALEVLREMLTDETLTAYGGMVVNTMTRIGHSKDGTGLGTEFAEMLQAEQAYWEDQIDWLPTGWWNHRDLSPVELKDLRNRYSVANNLLRGLKEMKELATRQAVVDFLDVWEKPPTFRNG